MQHPSVRDAAVVGKKDPIRGEVVVAFVTPRKEQQVQAEEIRDFCRQQGLAQWKIPARSSSKRIAALADRKSAEARSR